MVSKYLALLTAIMWLSIVFFSSKLAPPPAKENNADTEDQLMDLQRSVNELRQMNQELKHKLKELIAEEENARKQEEKGPRDVSGKHDYSLNRYEIERRKLERGLWEMFFTLSMNGSDSYQTINYREHMKNQYMTARFQLTSLLATSSKLAVTDEAARRRKRSLRSITERIQAKLNASQHGVDCSEAKFLGCTLPNTCGFGCQVHHLAYCLLVAFASSRMLIVQDGRTPWEYHRQGWTGAFHQPSRCNVTHVENWMTTVGNPTASPFDKEKSVFLESIEESKYRPDYLPLSIPKPLAEQLIGLHSNPPAFFIAQFVRFIFNPIPEIQKFVEASASQVLFDAGPIIGVHVRRSDKLLSEAKYYPVSEYMKWCEVYFQIQERKLRRALKRRIYVASDDPKVVPEIRKKYPEYDVFGDVVFAENALHGRYSERSLRGTITDIMLLSRCDYLVCTFSSQLCRLAYELMLVEIQGDVGENFRSLDEMYYFGGQHQPEHVAIEEHTPQDSNEISLEVGDVIAIKQNLWNGYFRGENRRTRKMGLYPSYKVEQKWRIVDFPALEESNR